MSDPTVGSKDLLLKALENSPPLTAELKRMGVPVPRAESPDFKGAPVAFSPEAMAIIETAFDMTRDQGDTPVSGLHCVAALCSMEPQTVIDTLGLTPPQFTSLNARISQLLDPS